MGLRQGSDIAPPQQSQASTSTPAPSAADLPPEAIALAGKLFDLAREGKTAELDQYTSAGIPLNLTNHKGDTLIMLAAYHGHASTVKMLVEKGVDMNVLNDRGQSPIAGAVFKGYEDVVRIMAEKGADLRAGQPNAIEAAMMFKRDEVLKLFGVEVEAA